MQTFAETIESLTKTLQSSFETLQGFVENMLRQLSQAKTTAGQKEQAAYITSKIADNFEKKSF